jgi:hypothetical protein
MRLSRPGGRVGPPGSCQRKRRSLASRWRTEMLKKEVAKGKGGRVILMDSITKVTP